MASQNDNASWKEIAARKQAYRLSQIPKEWIIPSDVIPQDPPKSTSGGPQNVLSIPNKFLTGSEIRITESHTVQTLLSAISDKKLTATEVIKAFCHRAAIAHQLTNCITEPLFKSAIERAEYLDNHFKQHGPRGPLHGLPVSIKDGFNIAGVDSTIGIASLCFKPATSNAPLVDLLLSLGCVIVAKTNVPQTLASLDSINNVFGRTMNPLNRQLTAGGSSGGEGVLVAMKGSIIGFGTDIGGSIRIPAMCNGIYGFKPSVGRLPYEGQQGTTADGISRTSVQATAGPLARSIEDINTIMKEILPISKNYSEDCVHAAWSTPSPLTLSNLNGSGPNKEYTIGILTSDQNCTPLPPIQNLMTELHQSLSTLHPKVKVIPLSTPKAWTKSQSLMSKIMSVEGGKYMSTLLQKTSEPLVPWMSTRFRTGPPKSIPEVANLQAQRSILEREMLTELWTQTDPKISSKRTRRLDAIICPLAPHPVPQIERYNAVGYTSSWVLFDNPAACVPVRTVVEADLCLGQKLPGDDKGISSWDEKNRELWDERKTDRRVYLGSPLCVQVVVPKGEDEGLITAMGVVEMAVGKGKKKEEGSRGGAKL